jgi:hypothetical protein
MPTRDDIKATVLATQLADAKASLTIAERRLDRITNAYDATDENAGRRRRSAKIERGAEASILTQRKALQATNLCRDLLRNFTAAKTIDQQKRVNVVGTGPMLKLHTDDKEWNTAVQDWVNNEWAKDCDSRDDTPWGELLACLFSSLGTDGGALVSLDTWDRDDGKLLFWTTDQLVTIEEAEWKNLGPTEYPQYLETIPAKLSTGKPVTQMMTQERGIVRDYRGRVVAYVVSSDTGLQTAKLESVTILPTAIAKLFKRPWRLNQVIPIPEYLPMVADMEDLYEMRLSELQTAKKGAKKYGWVKSVSGEDENSIANGNGPIAGTDAGADDAVATDISENYDKLEMLTGGYVDYLDPDDEVHIDDPMRPNEALAPFFDHCLYGAGASVGLAGCYTNLRALTSYTAFRGEMVMTWRTFYADQKCLERRVCDWLMVRLIAWGLKKGKVQRPVPELWERKIAWDFPRMPVIDTGKEFGAMITGPKGRGDQLGGHARAKLGTQTAGHG